MYIVVVEGVNAVAFVTLLVQAYVFAPEPESVTDVPAQTVWSAPALTVGKALTKTEYVAVAVCGEQALLLVTVIVKLTVVPASPAAAV